MLLSLIGVFVGLLIGLTGVGGGALMTPMLLLFCGVTPLNAIGTDLLFAALTKLAATKIHQNHGLIDWVIVKRLWLGSIPASFLTLIYIKNTSATIDVNFLKIVISFAILITAIGLLLQPWLHKAGRHNRMAHVQNFKYWQSPLTVLAGIVLGVLVTLTSIGAGAIGSIALLYLYPLRLTMPKLIATDIIHAIPLALFAGLGHLFLGNVDFALLGSLLLGSLPAVVAGAYLSTKLSHRILRIFLSIVLLLSGVKLLISVL